MTFDYYAYWNGEATAAVFQMIAGLTASGDFLSLAKSMTLFGLLSTVAAAAIRIEGRMILSWFAATVLFFFVALIPKCDVTVLDVRAMSAKTISGVPISIGLIAGTSSSMGRWLGEAFETAMTDVDAAKFSQFGAVFPERVVAAIEKAGPVLPKTRLLLNDFVTQCVAPEILDSDAKRAELMASTSLWDTVKSSGWVNPARFLLVDGEPLYCDVAIAEIEAVIRNEEIPAQEKLLMTRLTNADDGLTETALRKAIPEARALLLGTSESMEKSLEHAMLLTAFPEGISRAAERAGSPLAAGAAFAKAQGNLASEISFRAMGEIASAFLPKLRTALEFITLAAFPIVIVMAAAMGTAAGAVIRMYVTIFVWLMLWAPLAAVINYLLIHIDASPMSRLMEAYGGVTLESATLVRELGASSQAMAGYLMLLMPVVAFMIARASEMSATSLASAIMSPAGSAAGAASSAAAMGNISAGNASISNVSAGNTGINKTDLGSSFVSGDVAATTTPFGTVTRNAATGQVTGMSAASWNLGVTATTSSSAVASAVQSSSSDASSAVGQSAVRTTGVESTVRQAASHASSTGVSSETRSGRGTTASSTEAVSQSTGYASTERTMLSHSAMNSEGITSGLNGGIRATAGAHFMESNSSNGNALGSNTTLAPDNGDPVLGSDPALMPPPRAPMSPISSLSAGSTKNGGSSNIRLNGGGGQIEWGLQTHVTGGISERADSASTASRSDEVNSTQSNTVAKHQSFAQSQAEHHAEQAGAATSATLGNRETASLSDSNSFAQTQSRHSSSASTRQGDVAVRGDITQAIASRALNDFSSAEAFLEHYNNPAARAALIRGVNLDGAADDPIMQNLVPSNASDRPNASVLSKMHEIDQAEVRRHAQTNQASLSAERPQDMFLNDSNFESPTSANASKMQNAQLELGIARAAAAYFNEGATSPIRIADLSLTGAAFYSSPQELRNQLREEAQKNPELKESLIELGQQSSPVKH